MQTMKNNVCVLISKFGFTKVSPFLFGILRFWSYIYSIIKNIKHMKTLLGQLIEIQNQLDALKLQITSEPEPVCDGFSGCGCGCDEPEVETPVTLIRGEVITAPEDGTQKIVLTKDELITFATELTYRVITACKEAVTDTNLDTDSLVDLSMGYSYQIEVELDKDSIVSNIHDEIDDTIEMDKDSIEDEVLGILENLNLGGLG